MSENNDTSNEGSDSILQTSRLTSNANNPPVLRTGVLRPSVLGHSVLGSALNNSVAVTAAGGGEEVNKPKDEVAACNPFMREQKDDNEDTSEEDKGAAGGAAAESAPKDSKDAADEGCAVVVAAAGSDAAVADAGDAKKPEDDEEPDERPDPLTMLRKNGLERSSLFAAAKNSMPRVERSGFVFGQNVHERVTGENSSKSENSDGAGCGSGELLFSSVIQNAAQAKSNEGEVAGAVGGAAKETEAKSLTDVAREYEESRVQKRKYEEVETFTGEEGEKNIVDVNCKLFAFVNSNWEERGRGSLRLNDSKNEQECSRVVFRTSGNLRLLLNTKVWAGMVAERPSQKSLRLTAMDNSGKIKIFLCMARPVDINLLHKALVERIDLRKASHPEECRGAVAENNGDESKNGAAALHVDEAVQAAASVAVPIEHDDSTEPSPKKTLLAE